jgi:hypothetical protein
MSNNNLASNRRRLLGGSAATALAWAGSAAASAPLAARPLAAPPIMRVRYSLAGNFEPPTDAVTILPWKVVNFNDGLDCTLESDGKVLINTSGYYRITLSCDWVAQQNKDIDLRKMGVRRRRIDASSPPAGAAIDKHDDHLASTDAPGSDPPRMSRYQGEWNPGRIDIGATVTTEIQTSPSGIVTIGDMAIAAHTQIRDAVIGAHAVNALIMQAKVVADDTVRISLHNPSVAGGIQIPSGALHVVAMSAVDTRGHSTDAWGVLHTATEVVNAGERIYAVVRCRVPGDFLQALKTCFVQIEKLG